MDDIKTCKEILQEESEMAIPREQLLYMKDNNDVVTERDTHPIPKPYNGEMTENIKKEKEEAHKNAETRKEALLQKHNIKSE